MEAYTPTEEELAAAADAASGAGDPLSEDVPTLLGIPLERILTIGRPFINTAAATVATWLTVHVHFLALFHASNAQVSSAVEQLVIWVITAIFTDRALAQWVDNLIKHRATKAQLHAAIVQAFQTPVPASLTPGGTYSPEENPAGEVLTPEEVAQYDQAHGITDDPEADNGPTPAEDAPPPQGE